MPAFSFKHETPSWIKRGTTLNFFWSAILYQIINQVLAMSKCSRLRMQRKIDWWLLWIDYLFPEWHEINLRINSPMKSRKVWKINSMSISLATTNENKRCITLPTFNFHIVPLTAIKWVFRNWYTRILLENLL